MQLLRDPADCPAESKGAAVALGNFDGVHLGHQAILKECLRLAKGQNIAAAAMTFEPHPREFFARGKQKLRIYPFRRKAELLAEMGIQMLFAPRFNRRLVALTAEAFVRDILVRDLQVRHVVTGYNFAFGKGRAGNTAYLSELAKKYGFGFTACPPIKEDNGDPISSSAIRQAIAAGDMQKAAALLGRPYAIGGRVRRGHQRGKALGFPTANIPIGHLFRPRFGIYAARIIIGADAFDAVASLGINPTFGLKEPVLEAHGFDMRQELYGRRIEVELIEFLREEERFDSNEALKTQMEADCRQAREILHAGR